MDSEANFWQYESCNNQTADALDAYQRAFDLDPSNMHIKARLQLLRNNGQSTGMPNQQNAPVPQDVHPQQYQAAGVGAPPGPQWGVPAGGPASVLHGPTPSQNGSAPDWSRRLADIPNPQPPPQPSSMYDQREPIRPPPSQRQPSPRQEQLRQYQEQQRHTPIRRPSPPPTLNHNGPVSYSAPQALPQPQPSVSQPPASNRIPNPNYGAPDPGLRLATGSTQPAPVSRAPFGRGDSPPEIRPLADLTAPSPGRNYQPQSSYQHHPNTSVSVGIAAGAPPPAAALAAAEAAAARERDNRSGAGYKRSHDSDDEYKVPNKHPANGESRSRLENNTHRRASPPDRKPSPRPRQASPRGRPQSPYGRPASPPFRHSRSSSTTRREEQRRADENYHPSEAAHHPQALPAMQQPPPSEPPQVPASAPDTGREERREAYEDPARKMEVDEDYDDDAEEEKRKQSSGGRNSPQHSSVNGPPKVEAVA
jgi:glucose repression mediator protein